MSLEPSAVLLGDRVAEFLDAVGDVFTRVDVLVNNAGGGFASAFLEVGAKGQDALVRENFSSVTHFVRGVVPRMPERGGSIINLTSVEAHRAAPGFAIYAAMKAAVASVTRSLASDLSGFVTGTTIHVDGGTWAAGGWRRSPGGGFEL